MESKPLKTIPIHDHLRGKLCDLYENDCIFDKFECVWGGDDKCVISIWLRDTIRAPLTLLQACAHRVVPQLLPDIRRGFPQ